MQLKRSHARYGLDESVPSELIAELANMNRQLLYTNRMLDVVARRLCGISFDGPAPWELWSPPSRPLRTGDRIRP